MRGVGGEGVGGCLVTLLTKKITTIRLTLRVGISEVKQGVQVGGIAVMVAPSMMVAMHYC